MHLHMTHVSPTGCIYWDTRERTPATDLVQRFCLNKAYTKVRCSPNLPKSQTVAQTSWHWWHQHQHTNLYCQKMSKYPQHSCIVQSVLKEQRHAKTATTPHHPHMRYGTLANFFCRSAVGCVAFSCHDMDRGGCYFGILSRFGGRQISETQHRPRLNPFSSDSATSHEGWGFVPAA